mgnify:CR=1 FL=1
MRRLLPLLAAAQAYELCIGQDYWSIMNYTAVMGKPACVMSYASLYNLTAALWNGTEYGSGVEEELYDEDGYHPSEEGSAVLGAVVAATVAEEFGF